MQVWSEGMVFDHSLLLWLEKRIIKFLLEKRTELFIILYYIVIIYDFQIMKYININKFIWTEYTFNHSLLQQSF